MDAIKTRTANPADALLYYVEQEPLTQAKIAHCYGVSYQTVAQWLNSGQLKCDAHNHADDSTVYFACLMRKLRADNPSIKPIAFYKTRLRSHERLLSTSEAANTQA